MARTGAALGLFFLISAVVACDTAGEHAGCADGTDPSQCARSTFAAQNIHAADVSGIVRRGEDGVVGAQIHVAPALSPLGPNTVTGDGITDERGFYSLRGDLPPLYDLTAILPGGVGGRKDVLVYRNILTRYFEPQLEVPGEPVQRSWTAHVAVTLDAPIAAGHTLLFLAAGDGVFGVTGDLASGLDVHTANFSAKANIRAIEYDPAKGVISATAYGKGDVYTKASAPAALQLHLDPLTGEPSVPQFQVTGPPGFVGRSITLRIEASRTSGAVFVTYPFGETVTLPSIPDHAYLYEIRAVDPSGAISDSGSIIFNSFVTTSVNLPSPPTVYGPDPGASVTGGDVLDAGGPGSLEHVLEPKTPGAPGIRVIAAGAETTLPSLASLGIANATGNYTWTVRSYPTITQADNVGGFEPRRYKPFTVSAPRTLVLR